QLMIKKDDWICSTINVLFTFKNKFNLKQNRLLSQNAKGIGANQDIYIILNSPSVKNQDLSLLKGTNLMFVNRGFKHPLYKELQPKFHVFVDPKMRDGEWPVEWLSEIGELVPDITFVMPVAWAFDEKFKPFIEKGYKFHWLRHSQRCTCLGVGGSCFEFAINQKFKNIYFTGFEATGLAYELIQQASHFYGSNEENLKKSTKNYEVDLLMHSRHFHDLNRLAAKCKAKKINIFNFTEGGVLDMFPRKDIKNIIG
ncbi:MAG: hypothetical protein ACK5M3_17615, partial [Dysgonomonas sp.]